MPGNQLVIPALFAYLVIGAALVIFLRGIRGIMAAIVIGWMFLPPARGIDLPGLPQFTKEFSVSYALLFGVILSDASRLTRFRPKLLDLPILIYIISPFFSSITNGLGIYDGLSGIYFNFFVFGVPYLLGRVYIRTPEDVKTVAVWFVIAGLIAVPMVVWEARMSPQLNRNVYGYIASPWVMTRRMGGSRPTLFMRHGLEVGLWMATSGAVAVWLWITSSKQIRILNLPIIFSSVTLVVSTIVARSLGAIILLIGTAATAAFVRSTGFRLALIALVLVPSVYLPIRISNVWSPSEFTSIIRSFDAERASSLEGRLGQELLFSKRALKKPLFGWGGYDRFRPPSEGSGKFAVDGMTTITLGENGLVGLVSFLAMTALPSLLVILRLNGREITSAIWAPALGIILGISIFSIDMLFNSFYTPLHLIGIGVIASVAVQARQWQRSLLLHQQRMMNPSRSPPHPNQSDEPSPMLNPDGTKSKRAG